MMPSPIHWVLGFTKYGRAWLRWHQWYPNCIVLWRKLQELERE